MLNREDKQEGWKEENKHAKVNTNYNYNVYQENFDKTRKIFA